LSLLFFATFFLLLLYLLLLFSSSRTLPSLLAYFLPSFLPSFIPSVRALLTFLCELAKLLLLRFRSLARSLARLARSCAPDEEGSAAKAAEELRGGYAAGP
jgi:hypothetical protein